MKKAYIKGYKQGRRVALTPADNLVFGMGSNPYPFQTSKYRQWEKGYVSAIVDSHIDGKPRRRIPKCWRDRKQ